MTCDENRETMLDVLYGEELNSSVCFEFFRHLDACPHCSREYAELLNTREMLQGWQVDEPGQVKPSGRAEFGLLRRLAQVGWWPFVQRVAAGFLIAMGMLSVFQHYGYVGGRRVLVSEVQLAQMVQDLIVVNQTEERDLIRQALIHLKEDVELQRRHDMQEVATFLVSLEQRYAENLEESNRYLKALAAR